MKRTWTILKTSAAGMFLAALMAQLADEPTWNALAARMRTIAAAVCDPAKIHRQFLDEMPRRHRIV